MLPPLRIRSIRFVVAAIAIGWATPVHAEDVWRVVYPGVEHQNRVEPGVGAQADEDADGTTPDDDGDGDHQDDAMVSSCSATGGGATSWLGLAVLAVVAVLGRRRTAGRRPAAGRSGCQGSPPAPAW